MTDHPIDDTTQVLERPARLEYPRIELVVVEGPDAGARCAVHPGGVRIGTASSNEMPLKDRTVSRFHCEVRITGSVARLVDSGSTNGTFVDGVRVRDADLSADSKVRLGATVLSVSASGERAMLDLSPRQSFGEVLGSSVEMRRLYAILEKIAPTDTTVLVQGETGSGKELVARAIHDASTRASQPFVVVDCGAIAENLIESELFGHVRGAFSGAISDRRGLFEEADGGTLFLDEIGELPQALQPKLLRVLERLEVRRVGSNTSKQIDVRIVAATNRPLAENVNAGTFREDLYYRIAVVELVLPPLRARRDDIPMLAAHFFKRYAGDKEAMPKALMSSLGARAWPGNVRELRNFIERSVSLGFSPTSPTQSVLHDVAQATRLEDVVPAHLPLKDARLVWTEQFELLYVKALLEKAAGNVTRAAELAGVNRRSLQRLIASLGLRDDDPTSRT